MDVQLLHGGTCAPCCTGPVHVHQVHSLRGRSVGPFRSPRQRQREQSIICRAKQGDEPRETSQPAPSSPIEGSPVKEQRKAQRRRKGGPKGKTVSLTLRHSPEEAKEVGRFYCRSSRACINQVHSPPDILASHRITPDTHSHMPTFRQQRRSHSTTSIRLPLASARGRCVGCTCFSARGNFPEAPATVQNYHRGCQ